MTEQLISGGSPDAAPVPPGETELTESLTHSFWAVAWRAYWRSINTRIATAWVLLIAVLTVLVPFLANDAPYSAVINGRREWPLFKDLTRVDLLWLIWGAGAIVYAVGHLRARKKARELEQIRVLRAKCGGAVLIAAIILSIGILSLKTDFLDVRDYHQMVRSGQLDHAVFPPLHWGYAQQEPLEADMLYQQPTWMLDSQITRKLATEGHWHWLGTDGNGRDVAARLLWGTRVVLEIGLVSEIISLLIGAFFGAMMGYHGGKADIFGMRLVEVIEAIPLLFLLITFVALFGRQLFMIMIIIGMTGWTGIARFVRIEFLRIRQTDYVSAAKAMGLPLRNILFRHMLPNGLTPVIVSVTFGIAGNIVSESILSFLGIGVEPPTSSWGAMLNEAGNPGEVFRWWLALAPGIMIFLTVFAYNIMGETLRDAIDPRTNRIE